MFPRRFSFFMFTDILTWSFPGNCIPQDRLLTARKIGALMCFEIFIEKEAYSCGRLFLDAAASNGVWAALSLALIFFILRAQERRDAKQDEREQNYQKIIEELTKKLHIIIDMQEDIEKIRDTVTTHGSDTVGQ